MGTASERLCVIRQLVFTAAFLSIRVSAGFSSYSIRYRKRRKKKKKKKHTSFMGPLEHSDEVGAKLAFHISTRNQKEARLPHNN